MPAIDYTTLIAWLSLLTACWHAVFSPVLSRNIYLHWQIIIEFLLTINLMLTMFVWFVSQLR